MYLFSAMLSRSWIQWPDITNSPTASAAFFTAFFGKPPPAVGESSTMSLGKEIHRSRDSFGDINVFESGDTRTLCFGTEVEQSAMRISDPALLLFDYTRTMMLGALFPKRIRHALVLGLGGGSLARCLHAHFPKCRVTAVEMREAVADVAHDFFAMPDDDRMGVYICDAASYLAEPGKDADLIFADLYHSEGMDEQQTDTRFFHACRSRLADGGVAVFNHWSGRYFRDQEVKEAMDEVFDGQVLRVNATGRNRIALAFRDPLPHPDPKQLLADAEALGRRLGFPLGKAARRLWELNLAKLRHHSAGGEGSTNTL
jgi:spermidine synthase